MMITRRAASLSVLSVVVSAAIPRRATAQAASVQLPPPRTTGGKPLMEALLARRSTREYAPRALPPQILADLLWAAWGINRPANGLRTAPSAHESYDVDLYLAMADGVWTYDPKANRLMQYLPDDIRAETTTGQAYVATAPLNLVYVSDAVRLGNLSADQRLLNGVADCAVIAQNVYLYCASEGLATVLRSSVPGATLARRLNLKPSQAIYLAQSVGYPKG